MPVPPSLSPVVQATPTLTPPLPLILCHSPLLPFPLFLGSALLMLTRPTHTHGDPRCTCPCNRQDTHIRATHGTDHIAVHLKMCLSKLIRPLLHHDLLTSHLQTLAFWRRNHNDGPTFSWQTCPHARTRPDISLARVFTLCPLGMTLIARGIRFVHTHKTYAKTSAWRCTATDRLTFGATLLAML